jgi:uncharacterized protein YjiK
MTLNVIFSTVIVVVYGLLTGCPANKVKGNDTKASVSVNGIDTLPYNLSEPSHTINFANADLKEISGLSATEDPNVFCAVQDEKGTVFFIDAAGGGAILNKVEFKDKGDFEGVELVRKTIYAVKSDGDIYEISNWENSKTPKIEKYKTPLKSINDVEGLCYDKSKNALLLACKGNPDSANIREIYAFDLKTKQLSEKPVFTINPEEVDHLLSSDKDSDRFFAPSGIAIHPQTGDVFVISSVKKRMIVLDYDLGTIKYAVQLSKKLLPQPEGISFDALGNLYLSSEGKNGEGLLLKFNQKK